MKNFLNLAWEMFSRHSGSSNVEDASNAITEQVILASYQLQHARNTSQLFQQILTHCFCIEKRRVYDFRSEINVYRKIVNLD